MADYKRTEVPEDVILHISPSRNTVVVQEHSANGVVSYAYVRGVRPELTPGTQLSHVRLTTRKQDTVVFCVLESYEVYQQGQQAA